MEDFKLILYILAAVAYFLFTTWRKAFKDSGQATPPAENKSRPRPVAQQPARPVPQRPPVPATSFEDILREMQAKMERANEQHKPVVEKKPVPEARPEPTISKYDVPRPVVSLEKNAVEAGEGARAARQRPVAIFDAYLQKPAVAENRYAAMLRNPATVRDAVIVSEILRRKFD